MQLPIKYLVEMPQLDALKLQVDSKKLAKSHAFALDKGDIVRRKTLTYDYAQELIGRDIKSINIIPDNQASLALIRYLRTQYAADFPEPSHIWKLGDIERILLQYEEMAKSSDKKRELYLLQEISSQPHPVTGLRETIIPYNTTLDLKKVQRLKKLFDDKTEFEIRESEQGVLIITIAKDQNDTLNTIMAATDLVARLEKHFKLDLAYEISEAIEKFQQNNPRLVVFGNYKFRGQNGSGNGELNPKAQYTYLEMKNIDIYMKSLFIDQVNLEEQKEKLSREIMRAYEEPYSIQKAGSKKPLTDSDKSKYLNLLDNLNRNFNRQHFLKLSIQLKMIDSMYYVDNLKNQLVNIEKLHAFDAK